MSDVKFELGKVVITPTALGKLTSQDISTAIQRHQSGDWGLVPNTDKRSNELAVIEEDRILSAYKATNGTRFWIITEADRSSTCILLPEDY